MPLKGFISENDLNTIKVSNHNVEMVYDTSNANKNKPLHKAANNAYDFSLEGSNSSNYVLDTDSIPEVVSDVSPRPFNIEISPIYKTYDGTTLVNKNQGLCYHMENINGVDSGIIYGTKSTQTCLIVDVDKLPSGTQPQCAVNNKVRLQSNGYGYKQGEIFDVYAHYINNTVDNTYHVMIDEVDKEGRVISATIYAQNQPGVCELPLSDNTILLSDMRTIWNEYQDDFTHERYKVDFGEFINNKDFTEYFGLVPSNSGSKGAGLGIVVPVRLQSIKVREDSTDMEAGVDCDFGDVNIDSSRIDIQFSSKDVSTDMLPMSIQNVSLAGIKAPNYIVNEIYSRGIIIPRPLLVEITAQDKVYDGTTNIICSSKILKEQIPGDDISINEVFGQFEDKNVSNSVGIDNTTAKVTLKGLDAKNYRVCIRNIQKYKILPKQLQCKFEPVVFNRSSKQFELRYTIQGIVSGDNIRIDLSKIKLKVGNRVIPATFEYDGNIKHELQDSFINSNTGLTEYVESGIYAITIQGSEAIEFRNNDSVTIENVVLENTEDALNYKLPVSKYTSSIVFTNTH